MSREDDIAEWAERMAQTPFSGVQMTEEENRDYDEQYRRWRESGYDPD